MTPTPRRATPHAAAGAPAARHGRARLAALLSSATLAGVCARTGTLLAATIGLELWLVRATRLPEAAYGEAVVVGALARRLPSAGPLALLLLAALPVALAVAARHRSLGPAWRDFEHGARIRALAILVAAMLAWVFATYPYNHFFVRWHAIDRALLLALAAAIAWRPAFIIPFLLVLLPVIGQFDHPIGGFSRAAPMLLIRVLLLLAALWLVRYRTARIGTADFVFLLGAMVAAHYWVSGVGKLRLGWLASDQVAFLLPATYASGWLAFLDADTIGRTTATLAVLNWPMKIATLLLEAGALCALWRRGVLRALLPGWIALHAAIFALTGIAFWHWALLDAALLILFFGRSAPALPVFTRAHRLVALAVIGGGFLWFRPTELAWLDARASYTYRVHARAHSGRTSVLPPRFFAPYDYQFTLTDFRYLSEASHLAITWGATRHAALATALRRATTPAQVLALEAQLGRSTFDPRRAADFDRFVREFVGSWNERGGRLRSWRPPEAPPLLWSFARGPLPRPDDAITRVTVYQVLTFFDGRQYREIRHRPVRTIDVPPRPAALRH